MKQLSVSVIIPTYNRGHFVTRAIDNALSCIDASLGDRVIVVNDASTDDTDTVLEDYGDRIVHLRHDKNRGLPGARNTGIRHSNSDLIAFLDDDDEWMDNKLPLQRRIFEAWPELLFCFSNFSTTYKDGRKRHNALFQWGKHVQDWNKILGDPVYYSQIAALPAGHPDFHVYRGDLYAAQMEDDCVLPTTLMVRRTLAGDALLFDEQMLFLESWAYSSRLAQEGQCVYLDCDTAWQHGHNDWRLTDHDTLTQSRYRLRVLENQWGRDSRFLEHHAEAFNRRLDRELRTILNEYIAGGDFAAARQILPRFRNAPPRIHALVLSFPDFLIKCLLRLRATAKPVIKRLAS